MLPVVKTLATARLTDVRSRLRSLDEDDRGSVPVETILSVVVGAFILLGLLYVFRNQIWQGMQQLIENFFDEGSDVLDQDQNTNININLDNN